MIEKEEREDSGKDCVLKEQKLPEKLRDNMALKAENIKLQSKIIVIITIIIYLTHYPFVQKIGSYKYKKS